MLGVSATVGTAITTVAPILLWRAGTANTTSGPDWLMLVPAVMMLFSAVCFALGYYPRHVQLDIAELNSVAVHRETILSQRTMLASVGLLFFCTSLCVFVMLVITSSRFSATSTVTTASALTPTATPNIAKTAASRSGSFEGRVVGISDGDTLTVVAGRKSVKVRLAEIDAPESKQSFGTESKESLSDLCHQRSAVVDDRGRDDYGRTVGVVYCDGVDASAEQVRRGLAWAFDRYGRRESTMYRLQNEARAARRGLWADSNPIAPRDWRREQRLVSLAQ